MEFQVDDKPGDNDAIEKPSPVKVLISWLVETDREFRVAQSMVDETHDQISVFANERFDSVKLPK